MKRIGFCILTMAAFSLLAGAQQAAGKGEKAAPPQAAAQTPVVKSRSNVKNNIQVAQNPNGTLNCTSGDRPCSKEEVKALFDAANNVVARERFLKSARSNVAALEIAPDGSLKCSASDGGKCTPAHVSELNNVAAAMPGANDPIHGVGVGLGTKPNPSSK